MEDSRPRNLTLGWKIVGIRRSGQKYSNLPLCCLLCSFIFVLLLSLQVLGVTRKLQLVNLILVKLSSFVLITVRQSRNTTCYQGSMLPLSLLYLRIPTRTRNASVSSYLLPRSVQAQIKIERLTQWTYQLKKLIKRWMLRYFDLDWRV